MQDGAGEQDPKTWKEMQEANRRGKKKFDPPRTAGDEKVLDELDWLDEIAKDWEKLQ
jgi:hypothetical protein